MPSGLTTLLGDTSLTWTERRTRLQGWSAPDADQADATPGVQRIAAVVCAVGALAGAVTGSPLVLALVLGGTAAFVAATGICVPSLIFTALWGAHRAAAPSLVTAARTPRHPDQLPHDLIETARP